MKHKSVLLDEVINSLNIQEDKKYVDDIFKFVSKCKNVTKFEVVELSLHEIFTKEVGVKNEK